MASRKSQYAMNPAAGDAFVSNSGLRQRNITAEGDTNSQVQNTFGDPMHAIAVSNAQRNLLEAHTDVSGMGAVLQGIKEATGSRGKVGIHDAGIDGGPSAMSPASWNPAGMTQDAAQADASQFAKGGAAPNWLSNAAPDTQEGFRRRVLQGIKGARV